MPHEMWRLLKVAFEGWWNDRAMSLGASIAFFTVFSMAPMLLAAIAVAGLAFGVEAARGRIVGEFGYLIGEQSASALEAMIVSASNVGSGIIGTTVGIAAFLLLATGAIVELQDDLNIIWKVKPPASYGVWAFIRTRLLSLALVLGIGFLLLVSLVIDAGLAAVGSYLEARFSGAAFILQLLNSLVAFGIAFVLFAMIFKMLPSVDLLWHDVWTGALVTGLLFTLGKFLIGYYLGRSGVTSSYGAAASLITILLWIYYSALILLFGAEFTKAYAESRGSRCGKEKRATVAEPNRAQQPRSNRHSPCSGSDQKKGRPG
jgi:membrane protein